MALKKNHFLNNAYFLGYDYLCILHYSHVQNAPSELFLRPLTEKSCNKYHHTEGQRLDIPMCYDFCRYPQTNRRK